jgi:hypothetical protein
MSLYMFSLRIAVQRDLGDDGPEGEREGEREGEKRKKVALPFPLRSVFSPAPLRRYAGY